MIDLTKEKIDETLTPLEQENIVMEYLKANFSTNPKKLVKMVRRIEGNIPMFIRRSVIHTLLTIKNPVKYLEECLLEMLDYPVLIKQLIEEGNHGMIIDNDKLFGFEVKANPRWLRVDDKWNVEDEKDIIDEVVEQHMTKYKLREFTGRIMLFRDFGFSGMPYKINQAFTKEYYENEIKGSLRVAERLNGKVSSGSKA